jgi:hypothetical protein
MASIEAISRSRGGDVAKMARLLRRAVAVASHWRGIPARAKAEASRCSRRGGGALGSRAFTPTTRGIRACDDRASQFPAILTIRAIARVHLRPGAAASLTEDFRARFSRAGEFVGTESHAAAAHLAIFDQDFRRHLRSAHCGHHRCHRRHLRDHASWPSGDRRARAIGASRGQFALLAG